MNRPLLLLLLLGAATLPSARGAGSPARTDLIQQFTERLTGTVPVTQYTGQIREFTLEVRRVTTEISPGVHVEQWAFGFPGQPAQVPGPELRVRQGDLVRITLVNTHDQPHTLHLHGVTSLAQEMDGVPHTSGVVLPGQSFTYEFVATQTGTHAYHCHQQTNVHLDMGMYGALIIEPPAGTPAPWTAEHTLILDEWDSRQNPADLTHAVHPDLFLVNGRTFPLIPDVHVPDGQVDLVRVINLGGEAHSLHLHGSSFLIVAKDGYDLPAPYEADTLPVLPGERYDVLVKGRDGVFPWHDHNTAQNVNRGVYPGGQHFMLSGGQARLASGLPAPAASGSGLHGHVPASSAAAQHSDGHAPEPAAASLPTSEPLVRIEDFEYLPGQLTVTTGTTVTWQNDDTVPHHLVLTVGGREQTYTLAPGARVQVTFTQPGTFIYHCLPHPFMTGVIHVH